MITKDTTLGNIVTGYPELADVLETWGLDYCCGGAQALDQAAEAKGLDTQTILSFLLKSAGKVKSQSVVVDYDNPAEYDTPRLISHIKFIHHSFVREALSNLLILGGKVAAAHGAMHPKLVNLDIEIRHLRDELLGHLEEEESRVFPLLLSGQEKDPGVSKGMIEKLKAEHNQAGDALARIRELAENFINPPWACSTYKTLMAGLQEFELDMHTHVHLENNVLFRRI